MRSSLSDAPTVEYTVAAVAQRLGLATATLRSWTRRYGIGPDGHEPGTHRHYTEIDIAILERMLQLIRAGATPGSAARAAIANTATATPAFGDVDAVVDAAFRLDADRINAILRTTLTRDGVLTTWDELCRPALAAIEERHSSGDECIDVEHILSRSIVMCLQRVEPSTSDNRPPIMLACSRGEFHTLPLEALRAALAERGHTVRMLGASVPASAIRDSLTRDVSPRAVVVWSQGPQTARTSTLRRAAAGGAVVVAAGPGWTDVTLPHGTVAGTSLVSVLDLLA
ncbi:MerR family transcriptional regulator [Antrihabitans cavernicola]|uniref:MerR family transcriptional regulator n=1 Tax=Antrihabitans cavernicola TaxID=2495913 RepID=A0A5A7S9Y1_9NOCA|nr:MerR family transcriptional regulator [Spelaeibacter cavernicola]KAA0022960.1 MerR family transcriptional regulator [Spelaeibacter cavernicola]